MATTTTDGLRPSPYSLNLGDEAPFDDRPPAQPTAPDGDAWARQFLPEREAR